jgi:pilus assembly protein CpaB
MKQKILLVLAVIFGLLASYLTYEHLEGVRQKYLRRTKQVETIMLTSPIEMGGVITESDITRKVVSRLANQNTQEIPWVRKDFSVIKQKANRTLPAGTILRYSDIKPNKTEREGLAGVIGVGNRAISISVDSISSVNGLIKPEDRVDIIGTFRFPEMKGDRSLDVITMTILQSVRVIATGKKMGKNFNDPRQKSRGYNTVTLELTPKEVEMIVFATQKGRLTLSLRDAQETGFEEDLQSVNFRYLEENIKKYHKARKSHAFR